MTTQSVKPTAYDTLANEIVSVMTCMWGSSGNCVIGFRGGNAAIERMLTLFANFDFDDVTQTPASPPTWLYSGPTGGLAYLTLTPERIRKCLTLFFHCEILRVGEVPLVHRAIDADPTDETENATFSYETSYDEAKVARLAEAYADRFIRERIKTSSFMPPPQQSLIVEHSLGTMVSEPNDRMLEELVEQEAKVG